jgi:hypothetical protein
MGCRWVKTKWYSAKKQRPRQCFVLQPGVKIVNCPRNVEAGAQSAPDGLTRGTCRRPDRRGRRYCRRESDRRTDYGRGQVRPSGGGITGATGPRVASGFIDVHTRTFDAKLHFGPTVVSAVGTGRSGCPGNSEETPETTESNDAQPEGFPQVGAVVTERNGNRIAPAL